MTLLEFQSLVENSGLIELISKYDRYELLNSIVRSGGYSYAIGECLLVATNYAENGNEKIIKKSDLNQMMDISFSIIRSLEKEDANIINALQNLRNLRPYWFTIPIYSSILESFNSKYESHFGVRIDYIFDELESFLDRFHKSGAITHVNKKDTTNFSVELCNLLPEIVINIIDLKDPSDLWGKGVVQFENLMIFLDYKIEEIVYRVICGKLEKIDKRFGTKKGKALEREVVKAIQSNLNMKGWSLFTNFYIDGDEKDILFYFKHHAIPIEVKSTDFRGSSSFWSVLNLYDDINKKYIKGLNQITPTMKLAQFGGKIFNAKKKIIKRIKKKKFVLGMVITDDIYAPYVRASIDEVAKFKEGEIDDIALGTWHGENVWVGSIFDLYFLTISSGTISLFLDYFRWIRSIKRLRFTDELESWLAYGSEAIIPIVTRNGLGETNIILNEYDWDLAREKGVGYFKPPWLITRADMVKLESISDEFTEELDLWKEIQKNDLAGNLYQSLRMLKNRRKQIRRLVEKEALNKI